MKLVSLLLVITMFIDVLSDDSWEPTDEYSIQMQNAAQSGIALCSNRCKNIAVVGAGVAGLTAALELSLSGHNVSIYEASNRVGGRVLTYRNLTYGYITELGAMRLPLDVHTLLRTYIQRLNLTTQLFVNDNDNAIIYLNDRSQRVSATYGADDFGFEVKNSEKGKSASLLWNDATAPLFKEFDLIGRQAFYQKYESYSIDSYLNLAGMSRGAIDYIGLMLNLETSMSSALTEIIQGRQILDQPFYHIIGGNDLLTNSLLAACSAVPNKRCSIQYGARVSRVTLHNPNEADITYADSNATSPLYDQVIIATTAKAANTIDFNDRLSFIEVYRAMRQIHYDCASKVVLFFRYQWWIKNAQVNIRGGHSTTDLPTGVTWYHNFNPNTSSTGGAAIIASYTRSQNALLWQSIPDNEAFEIALENMDRLHPQEIRNYWTGGKTKHWCDDPYAHGANAMLTPFQAQNIDQIVSKPVKNVVYFIGDYTSSIHAWMEGATLSALRAVMQIQEEYFDVVIVGGGPIGLLTAIQLAKNNAQMSIVIIEQFTIGNTNGSSHDNVRQFRQPHSELDLAKLAKISFSKWRQLESDLDLVVNSLLNTTGGFLYFGNGQLSPNTTEGNLNKIEKNCNELQMNCEIWNSTQMRDHYPFFTPQSVSDRGVFHADSGYINVTLLLATLRTAIETKYTKITLRENEEFLDLDQSVPDVPNGYVRLRTSRGSLQAKRIVFVPGPYAKNVSATLGFNLNMTMWELPTLYFRLNSPTYQAPTWLFSGGDDQSLFNGYPIEASDRPGFMKISPEFIEFMNDPLIYPKDRRGSQTHFDFFIAKTKDWISRYATYIDYHIPPWYDNTSTCLATFVPDNGFIIDRLPPYVNYSSKIVMYAAGWGMKFAPVWAEILTSLVLGTESTSPYVEYLPNFRFNIEGRVITPQTTTMSPLTPTTSTAVPTPPSTVDRGWKIVGILFISIVGLLVIISVIYLSKRWAYPAFRRSRAYQPV